MANGCNFAVIIPWGYHPFPSRTRKLSPTGPIVLYAKVCGRVGRRRIKFKATFRIERGLLCFCLLKNRVAQPPSAVLFTEESSQADEISNDSSTARHAAN